MIFPFTDRALGRLCRAIQDSALHALTVAEYCTQRPAKGFVILRCDVDDRPDHALRAARLLHRHKLRATFYWQTAPGLLRPDLMQQIAALGHEIGYHHAALSDCGGDMATAITHFEAELTALRSMGFTMRTAAAHGVPGFDNQALFRQHPDLLAACDLVGEGYASIDFSRVQYLSDAGWAWRRFPLRSDAQRIRAEHGAAPLPGLRDGDLLALLQVSEARLYLNIHPELWFRTAGAAAFFRWRRGVGRRLLGWTPVRRVFGWLKGGGVDAAAD